MSNSQPDENHWFAAEILPHDPVLRGWLHRRFPALSDIDDVVQETYVRAVQARNAGRITAIRPFLFTAARNLALDRLRHNRVADANPLTEIDESTVIEHTPGVPETIGRQQEIELLRAAIESLPARCREVLTLRKIHGLSQKEVAAHLGIAEHTVEAQIRIGVQRCAAFLARHGLP